MSYSLEPAYLVQNDLTRLIIDAGKNPINKWFFADGCFSFAWKEYQNKAEA